MTKPRLYFLSDPKPDNMKGIAMAVWTGEFRPPKKGEWYLSGAIAEAHQAKNDMKQCYHIVTLVEYDIKE